MVESVAPRFDGLYIKPSEGRHGAGYIRFFPSGKACAISYDGDDTFMMAWLRPDPARFDGEYSIDDNLVRLTARLPPYVVEYSGTIGRKSMKLTLRRRDHFGDESFGIWRFGHRAELNYPASASYDYLREPPAPTPPPPSRLPRTAKVIPLFPRSRS
jgi:hypothetical protein